MSGKKVQHVDGRVDNRERQLGSECSTKDDGLACSCRTLRLLLACSVPHVSIGPTTGTLVRGFNDLSGIFSTSISRLRAIPKVNEGSTVLVSLIRSLRGQYTGSGGSGMAHLNGTSSTRRCFVGLLNDRRLRGFIVMALSGSGHVITDEVLTTNDAGRLGICSHSIIRCTLFSGTDEILVSRGRPNKNAVPSTTSVSFALSLEGALGTISVRLTSRVVINNSKTGSVHSYPAFEGFFAGWSVGKG